MTTEEIQERLTNIREGASDYEGAHGREDELYEEFIRYVQDLGLPIVSDKARLVLTSKEIEFPRLANFECKE